MRSTLSLFLVLLPAAASAQTTLQLDDGTMEAMWSLTSPQAGPADWIGVAYDPPFEHPFRVVGASMHYLDTYCCSGGVCSAASCPNLQDWEQRVIAAANLSVDSAGLTPDVSSPIYAESPVYFAGPGSTATAEPWTLTPDLWTLPAGVVFDHPGRIFYAIKYFANDTFMRFAVDDDSPMATNGFGIHTSDGFTTRSSIWSFGNVGMRITVEPIFFLKVGSGPPQDSLQLDATTGVTMLSLRAGGGTSATTVSRVRVRTSGSGNDATGVASVRLVLDADADGVEDAGETTLASGSFAADDGFVDLTPNRTLGAGAAEEWIVVYDFTSVPSGGDTFQARIGSAVDVDSNLGDPYVSGTAGGTGGITGATVTIAGRLGLSLGAQTAPAQVVAAGSTNLPALQIRLTSDDEAFDVTHVRITAGGTIDDVVDLTGVRLYHDTNSDGAPGGEPLLDSGTFALDDGALDLTFAPVTVGADQSEDLLLVVDLSAGAAGGEDFRAILGAGTDVTAAGVASGPIPATGPRALFGAPVIGNLQTVGGALVAAAGAANPPAGTAQPGTSDVPMLQVQLTAQAEAVALTSLTFTGSGSGDELAEVVRAHLYRDVNANGLVDGADAMIGLPQSFAADDGVVTFAVGGEVVPAGASRSYLLAYDFSATPTGGETFTASLVNATDVVAAGQASGAPIDATGGFPLAGGTRTMLGGLSIALAPENPPASNVQPGAADVPVLALSAAAQGEDFDVSGLTLTAAGSLLDDAGVAQVELWRDAGVLGVRDAADTLLAAGTYGADDGTAALTFARTIPAGTTDRWLVTYDLTLSPAPGQTFRASVAGAADVAATGTLSGPASATGLPATGSFLSVGGTLQIAAGPANPLGGSIGPSASGVVMMQARLTASLEPITVTGVTFTGGGTADEATDVAAASIWVDTDRDGQLDPVGDVMLGGPAAFSANDGTVAFSFAGRTIGAGANEDWIVVYDLAGSAAAGETFQLTFMSDTDAAAAAPSGPLPRVSGAPVSAGARTVLGSLTMARGPNTPPATTVRRDGTGVPVLQLRLTSEAEAFSVTDLTLLAAGSLDDAADLSGVTLLHDADGDGLPGAADPVLAGPVAFSGDDGAVDFTGFSVAVPAGGATDLLVVADLSGTAAGGSTFRLNLPSGANLTATGFGGRAVTPAGGPISANTLTVGGTVDVGLGLSSPIAKVVVPGEVGVVALQLRLAADVEPATLTALTLDASGTGDDAASIAAVDLYVDGDGDGAVGAGEPMIGTGAFSANDGSVTFSLSQAVQVGPALHLLAVVSMAQSPVGGETFQLGLDPVQDVTITSASGAVVVTGVPVDGALLTAGGGFEVALGPMSNPGALVNQSLQNVPLLQLDMRAVNEACTVDGLTLRAIGSIDDATDVAAVRLMRDVNDNGVVDFADVAVGTAATYTNDDGTVTFTGLGRALGTNASERWLVVYDLSGSASNLETFAVRLEDDADVSVTCSVSGPVIPTGAPIESGSFTIQEDGALVVTRGAETPPALFLPAGSVRSPVLQLRVASTVQDLTLSSVAVTATVSAGAVADTVAAISLFEDVNQDGLLDRNDRPIGTPGTPDAGGKVTFGGLSLQVPVAEAAFLIAAVDVAGGADPGTTFSAGVADPADAEASSAFGTAVTTGPPAFGDTMTVAGHLNLAAGPATPMTVQNDAEDVVALDFSASALWEAFRLRSVTVTAEGTMDPASAVAGLALVSDEDGDGAFGAADRVVSENVRFPEGSARTTFAGLDEAVAPGADRRFLVVVDLDGVAQVDQTMTLSIAANVDVIADGDSVGLTSPVGAPIVGSELTVGSSLQIAPGAMLPSTIVSANAEGVPALSLSLTAFNEEVTVSRITLSTEGTLDDAVGVAALHLLLDADGDGEVDPEDVEVAAPARPAGDDGVVTFAPLAEVLSEGVPATYLVTLDLSGAGSAGDEVRFSLVADADITAFGSLSGVVSARGAPVEGRRVTLVGALNVRLGASSPIGVGVEPGSTFEALQLELFTQGETVSVEQLALTLEGTADDAAAIAKASLYRDLDGDGVAGDADPIEANARPDGDDGRLVFEGLALAIDADTSLSLLIELELAEDAPTGGTIRLMLASNEDVRATGGVTGAVETVGAPLVGSAFTVVKAERVPGPAPEEGGCGCTATGGTTASPWLMFLLLGVVFFRR